MHQVTIRRPFFVSATEVTNSQFEQFDAGHRTLRGKLGFSSADDEAVVFVSWHEAMAFCRWLSQREGRPYRLPTEAEWEYTCRAGTTTPFSTGETLPPEFSKNVGESWFPGDRTDHDIVTLLVGQTPPNAWGVCDMHGNVEEWCLDWYGPYAAADQADPVGIADGDFRVTRGGSHSTQLEFLRSANRAGTLPDDKSWLIGFRVVQGELPNSDALPVPGPAAYAVGVRQEVPADIASGPDPEKPYFQGPQVYVRAPSPEACPIYNRHNHCPALVNCPNGDLLALWYTCRDEPGRELAIVASRLPYGSSEWQPASSFWDAPDRNDHASALWVDEQGTIYHFNGLSAAATWGSLATVLRTSQDNGATWSKARLIMPEHGLHHMPIESVIGTREDAILVPCDAVTDGDGGSAVLVSRDQGQTWRDPGEDQPAPQFAEGQTGAWIAGIHAGFTQLANGRLLAFGRGNSIDGHMPLSLSDDLGASWTYHASPFSPLGSGQRLVILRLREGPILFCSFDPQVHFRDARGRDCVGAGLFAALSHDEGQSWQIRRLITDDGPPRELEGGGNTGRFTLSAVSAEPRGYLSICQAANGVIHLISSKQHYAFNLAWLRTPPPAS
ncbi:MAG: SUMF1/EgtB/PvdO family nonheme iron enzyme [Pirellulaceae bacterium]